MLLFKIACNQLGISWVPINPDYRPGEVAYLLTDAAADLAVCVIDRKDQLMAGVKASGRDVSVHILTLDDKIPQACRSAPVDGDVHPLSEASLLYTSGTTGRPKGCILSHEYELEMGRWYTSRLVFAWI